MELAGFFAAHAVWCVSDGATLIPLGAHESRTGERQMARFAGEQLEECVERGQAWLASAAELGDRAVFVYDGYVTLGDWRSDALFVETRSYRAPEVELTMAVPYRHARSPEGFAVYKPKFMSFKGQTDPDYSALGEAFFAGVYQHEKGAAVWDSHIDETR